MPKLQSSSKVEELETFWEKSFNLTLKNNLYESFIAVTSEAWGDDLAQAPDSILDKGVSLLLPTAAKMGKDDLVKFLLENGFSNISDKDLEDMDALYHVLHPTGFFRETKPMVEYLVSHGANKENALLYAAEDKEYDDMYIDVVKDLLTSDPTISHEGVMVAAAKAGNLEIFAALLDHGMVLLPEERDSVLKKFVELFKEITSQIRYSNRKGDFTLKHVAENEHVHREKAEKALQIVDLTQKCLNNIPDLDRTDIASKLLGIAAGNGENNPNNFFDMVDLLLQSGADVNTVTPICTPLQASVMHGTQGMVQHLLEANGDPTKEGVGIFDGFNSLMLAKTHRASDEDLVKLLAEAVDITE